jgi:hypothetical protein
VVPTGRTLRSQGPTCSVHPPLLPAARSRARRSSFASRSAPAQAYATRHHASRRAASRNAPRRRSTTAVCRTCSGIRTRRVASARQSKRPTATR